MIDRENDLPITKQAEVLRISRGSVYYLPRPVSSADLAIMRHLDRLHLEFLRNGSTSFRLQGLQNKAECLGTSVQIVDHPCTVACLVGRGPGIDVIHSVAHSVVEQDCDLAGRCGDCLGLADAGRESSVKGAERSVGASDGYGSKAQKTCGPTAGSARS